MGFFPADAAVGDALSVGEWLVGGVGLFAFDEVAFYHDAKDGAVAILDLGADILGDDFLFAVVFEAVGVAKIDHDVLGEVGFL